MISALLVVVLTASLVAAADIYTVWSSVIYNRPGELKPSEVGPGLTSIGALEVYSSGQFFRSHYLTSNNSIRGISTDILNTNQLFVATLDSQDAVGSAQAFVQGLYPPYDISNGNASVLDPTAITSTGTYVRSPLDGYQYPHITVANPQDADHISLGGNVNCPAFDMAVVAIRNTTAYQNAKASSVNDYNAVKAVLVNATTSTWDFDHAFIAYRAISYLDTHDRQSHLLLEQYRQPGSNRSYVDVLGDYAAQQQQLRLTNMSALNQVTGSTTLPNTGGSISTIAGNSLAPRLLWHLQQNIRSRGAYYKLSLLFGGHDPIVSLIALLGIDSNAYTGLPQRGSAMAFELYSLENSTTPTYPSLNNMRVAFKFRNGTATDAPFSGPSQVDMSWDDFESIMTYLSIGGTGDWCQQCGSDELFCAAWNMNIVDPSSGATAAGQAGLGPIAAGAVGAVVALAVAALIFILVMLLGRFRFHRQPKNSKSALGGFKGSAKLASDADLVVAKNGVNVAATSRAEGHERTGSWEMRAKEQDAASRISLEDGNPFADPVRPHEHV